MRSEIINVGSLPFGNKTSNFILALSGKSCRQIQSLSLYQIQSYVNVLYVPELSEWSGGQAEISELIKGWMDDW